MVSTSRGIRKNSTVRARAKELGGMMHTSLLTSTKLFSSKFFGSTVADLDGQHVAGNTEKFHGARQGEGVGRDDAHVALDVDEALFVEVFRIDGGRVDVGEHLEFIGTTHVVAVAGNTIRNHTISAFTTDLALNERFDHAVLLRHAANPLVRFDAHGGCPE